MKQYTNISQIKPAVNCTAKHLKVFPVVLSDSSSLFMSSFSVCFVIVMNLIILTCVLWKAGSDADLQRFTGRLQYRYVALTLDKHNLPGAATTQEAPVLLLQLHLQSAGHTCTVHGRINSNSAKESSFAELPHIFSFILITCEHM